MICISKAVSQQLCIPFSPCDVAASDNPDTTTCGDSSLIGGTPLIAGDNNYTRVQFTPGNTKAADRRFNLGSADEAWVTYCLRLAPGWDQIDNYKLPGFSSQTTSLAVGGQGGGGGAGGTRSWSARMIISRPGTSFTPLALGFEIYHAEAHSSQPFGDPEWWGSSWALGGAETSPQPESALTIGQVHTIKQHVKLNTPFQNDGILEGWLDGNLLYRRTDFKFTDMDGTNGNPDYHDIRFWFNGFSGGNTPETKTNTVYYDGFNYSLGSVDNTCNLLHV